MNAIFLKLQSRKSTFSTLITPWINDVLGMGIKILAKFSSTLFNGSPENSMFLKEDDTGYKTAGP